MMRGRRQFGALAAMLAAALSLELTACSGTGGSGGPPPPPLIITTSTLPNAVQGQAYNQTLQATGGVPPDTWSLSPGSQLPAGLSLSSSGTISGTPTGPFGTPLSFSVQVQDSTNHIASKSLSILTEFQLLVLTTSLPDENVGVPYSATLSASGGVPPYLWSLAAGSTPLPAGLTLSNSGQISGVATASGSFSPTFQVTDAGAPQQTATHNLSLMVTNNVIVLTSSLPDGVVTRPYSQTLQAVGGTPPYTWSIASGTLLAGLTLSATTGVISGTPTASGSINLGVKATDSSPQPQSGTAGIFFNIQPLPNIVNDTLPDGAQNAQYNTQVQVQGGIGPYILQITSGSLPAGLSFSSLNTTGFFNIVGTPTNLGTSSFSLQVNDSSSPPLTATKTLSIRVNPLLVLPPVNFPPAVLGQQYSFTLTATGGLPPLTWSAFSLPAGLSLDPSTGIVSGTPTTLEETGVSVTVQDSSNPPQIQNTATSMVVIRPVVVNTANLPPVMVNVPMTMVLAASGGIGPFNWAVSSGNLPPGVSLDSPSGTLQGTPTSAGAFSFTVKVSDLGAPPISASGTLTLTVKGSLGRNDTPATATPLSNGTYEASISPFADPPSGPANPDVDVYQISASPGAVTTIETFADRLNPRSSLDTVIEVVDQNGNRLNLCSATPDFPDGIFQSPCMDDDIISLLTTDSKLFLQVPSGNSGPLTFFVRVLDFRGDARPDLIYKIQISGAN